MATGTMESALGALRAHSDNPSGYLALNQGNAYFTEPGLDGFVAFRAVGRYLVQFGGPFAAAGDRAGLLAAFLSWARSTRRRVVAVQVQAADARLYAARDFTVNQLGASYAVELATLTLRGGRFMQLRNKISRARRAGLTVVETTPQEHADELATIDRTWLRGKGAHVKQLEFLVGELGGPGQQHRRLFLGSVGGTPVGYLSYAPVFGSWPGWLHDLSRRAPQAPAGTMEALNVTAADAFRAEGAAWLHFGFTPFVGLDPAHEVGSASRGVGRFIRLLAERGERIYPARTQLAYKAKWGPQLVLPEFLAFQGRPTPGAIWTVLRVTRSV